MEFWIDVGGTFTDCIGSLDDGRVVRHKVLSSGVTKGSAAAGSGRERIIDPLRCADPAGFWKEYSLRVLDQEGRTVGESRLTHFDALNGVLQLASPLPNVPQPGQPYELTSGEESPLLAIRYALGVGLEEACRRSSYD